jgi:hypothetical protein
MLVPTLMLMAAAVPAHQTRPMRPRLAGKTVSQQVHAAGRRERKRLHVLHDDVRLARQDAHRHGHHLHGYHHRVAHDSLLRLRDRRRHLRHTALAHDVTHLAHRVAQAGGPAVPAHYRRHVLRFGHARLRHRRSHLRDELADLRAAPASTAAGSTSTATTSAAPPGNLQAIAQCESGGDPSAIGGGGTYGGLYQFDEQTWHAVGGSGSPAAASPAEQTERAQILYSRRGASAWPVCGR